MSTLGLLSFLGGIICLFGFIFSKKKLWSQILAIFGIIIVLTSFHAPAALIMGILFILLGLYGSEIITITNFKFFNNSKKSKVILAICSIFIVILVAIFTSDPTSETSSKTTSTSDSQNTKVYSTQDLKVTVSKAIVHNTDWLIEGKTKAPNNSKIAAVIIDNSSDAITNMPISTSDDIKWAKVKDGNFSAYIEPLQAFNASKRHAGDTVTVYIVALENYEKKDTDTIPAHVRKQIKKTKPYTLTLTKAQADYQNSLDGSKKDSKKASSSSSKETSSSSNIDKNDDSESLSSSNSSTSSSKVSSEDKAALEKAQDYATEMNMSKQGVYEQLTSDSGEGFTTESAQYAINHLTNIDWNANALAKAKDYQSEMSMSRSAILDQLTSSAGEQFTQSQAQYAVDHLPK
ncbi:Ltp family lipoprotein [Lactiplantibacillus argentoratensis]|uniref:Ltp family lipoprotein n=1 Tax=Lactiplantibacillus argentoratensis TaxID=271881 RepID=UPI001FF084D8|nr:Ltp family lipoprotein [Lactiplantibacillus argentoratensis]